MTRVLTLVAALFAAAPLLAPDQVSAGSAWPALVDSAWLRANLEKPDLVVLDVRNKLGQASRKDFEAGHVPGAVYSDYLRAGWRTKVDGIAGQLPPLPQLEALIGGLGIGNDSHVVIVAGGQSALDMGSATRVYFTFKVLGHDAVSVLDGGWKAYAADPANPIESGWNTPEPEIFAAKLRPELLADRVEVASAAADGTALIDYRPPPQFEGRAKHPLARRAGTIPGARSLPESRLTEASGHFTKPETLTGLLAEIGVAPESESIAFCNTGHWASLGWFANYALLGNEKAKLYDGSMVDWTAMDTAAVEKSCATC